MAHSFGVGAELDYEASLWHCKQMRLDVYGRIVLTLWGVTMALRQNCSRNTAK